MAGIYRKSRLSRSKQLRLMEHFVAGTTARTASGLVGVNPKAAAYYFHRLREIIEQASEDAKPLSGEIEVDESYFGGSRKGKRGRGAAGKTPVFGLLKRGGKVYARVIPDVKSRTLGLGIAITMDGHKVGAAETSGKQWLAVIDRQ
jgi:transposase